MIPCYMMIGSINTEQQSITEACLEWVDHFLSVPKLTHFPDKGVRELGHNDTNRNHNVAQSCTESWWAGTKTRRWTSGKSAKMTCRRSLPDTDNDFDCGQDDSDVPLRAMIENNRWRYGPKIPLSVLEVRLRPTTSYWVYCHQTSGEIILWSITMRE